ncbi:hypothetical protein TWF694_007872 [Orbilia ellipsospora]|uniref:Uncharacterized protein n=1 Tax=Orbilia ellipsospora TaxID=2528407 RepID=A0AAV9XQN7_9PEZI
MAAKLPLTTRKDIRDGYNARVPEYLEKLKEYTGEEWKFTVNFDELFQKVHDPKDPSKTEKLGSGTAYAYESFTGAIRDLTKEGEETMLKEHINHVISTKEVNVIVDDLPDGYYCTCRIRDGVCEIVYKPGYFSFNTTDIHRDLPKALDESYAETNKGELPLKAKQSLLANYEERKEQISKRIKEQLLGTELKMVVDPEECWRVAVREHDKLPNKNKHEINLDTISYYFGSGLLAYFEHFASTCEMTLKQDDMMVEAFLEACDKQQVEFRLVPQEELTRSYNDAVFIDGVYVMRTSPKYWTTNTSDTCRDLESFL